MSIKQTPASGFQFQQLNLGHESADKPKSNAFAVQLAQFQTQTLNTLLSASAVGQSGAAGIFGAEQGDTNPLFADQGSVGGQGLSADGRNLSLFDPESAYRMMSVINQRELNYQAEFAALTEMGADVTEMRAEGMELAELDVSSSNAQIRAELEEFVAEYNAWRDEYQDETRAGGALADSNAARMSRYELEQSIQNSFTGAADGFRGMNALGVSIDPSSGRARLDPAALDAALADNRRGAVATIDAFSAHFAEAATLLNADNNFIQNRLANLSRVIDYLKTNKTSLQAEFGSGDAGNSKGIADALAAYQKMAAGKA